MRTKTLPDVNGRSYELRRMDPITGSHIYLRMMGTIAKVASENTQEAADAHAQAEVDAKASVEDRARILIGLASMYCSYEDTQFFFKHALRVVSEVVTGTSSTIPVRADDGRWADPTLEDNPQIVQLLVNESLVFSLTPFFVVSGQSTATGDPAATSL